MFDFTNYRDHPGDSKYFVIHYAIAEQADFYESLLKSKNLFYERYNKQEEGRSVYYFAIKKSEEQVALHLNNIAIGKFRSRFIPDKGLRWIVFIISFVVLSVAIIGFVKSLQ